MSTRKEATLISMATTSYISCFVKASVIISTCIGVFLFLATCKKSIYLFGVPLTGTVDIERLGPGTSVGETGGRGTGGPPRPRDLSGPQTPRWAARYLPTNAPAQHVLRAVPDGFAEFCEQLFTGDALHYNFTTEYMDGIHALREKISSIRGATPEGSSGTLREEILMLHYLARAPGVSTVCETGFNVGYSSFGYLTGNPNVTVHSFDLNRHKGTGPMVDYLKGIYGERLQVHFGDSMKTLPEFHSLNSQVKCDLILVDGGHGGEVPYADISNFIRKYAVPHRSLLVFDDYPTAWGLEKAGVLSVAWQRAVHKRLVAELFRCTFKKSLRAFQRGFVVGLVIKRGESSV